MPLLEYLQEGFHLRTRGLEALRVMPFVQLCILNLLGISCCWDCMFCVADVHVSVCAGGLFPPSHTHTCKTTRAQKHTRGVFHLRHEARPPSAFLTCNHVQICTGRQGEGESHVNLCGCFLFFFFFFPASYKTRFWLPPISDARDPNHLLKPFKRRARKHFSSPSVLFQLKVKFGAGREGH